MRPPARQSRSSWRRRRMPSRAGRGRRSRRRTLRRNPCRTGPRHGWHRRRRRRQAGCRRPMPRTSAVSRGQVSPPWAILLAPAHRHAAGRPGHGGWLIQNCGANGPKPLPHVDEPSQHLGRLGPPHEQARVPAATQRLQDRARRLDLLPGEGVGSARRAPARLQEHPRGGIPARHRLQHRSKGTRRPACRPAWSAACPRQGRRGSGVLIPARIIWRDLVPAELRLVPPLPQVVHRFLRPASSLGVHPAERRVTLAMTAEHQHRVIHQRACPPPAGAALRIGPDVEDVRVAVCHPMPDLNHDRLS